MKVLQLQLNSLEIVTHRSSVGVFESTAVTAKLS